MRSSTFGFHKMLGNYQVATWLVASRVVLSSIELVSDVSDTGIVISIQLNLIVWGNAKKEKLSRDSSVGVTKGCRLYGGELIPWNTVTFCSLHRFQIVSGVYPATYPKSTGVSPGVEWQACQSHYSLKSRKVELYIQVYSLPFTSSSHGD
jgi:hypothetical protein